MQRSGIRGGRRHDHSRIPFHSIQAKTEGHFFDRKSKAIDGRKLQKIIVAFANADGGEVVVGIADDSDVAAPENRWNGFTDLEDLNGLLQAVFSLNPTVDVRYEVLNSPSPGYVLRIFVEKGSQVHKTSDGHVYVRYGRCTRPQRCLSVMPVQLV